MINMIVAVDRGNAIGWSDGRLAWTGLKEDMARFKRLTTGHTVVMGMNTWRSLKRPQGLPNRKNVVLTRRPYPEVRAEFAHSPNVDIISSLSYIEDLDRRQPLTEPDKEFWLIGGATVYDEALNRGIVTELHLTIIDGNSGADVRLGHDLAAWKLFVLHERAVGREWEPAHLMQYLDNGVHTTYLVLVRIR